MSFKQNNMINLGNYEEYFILYMDNELSAEEKLVVEKFISQHPHLAEELEILISTRLPVDEVSFEGKEELLASSMKSNIVDESLLLYIDNELTPGDKAAVEKKINADKDYALQHAALMQTKLDASERVLHPNKKELYRHSEKVISLKVWMRVAAAVVLLLLGSLYFLNEKTEINPGTTTAGVTPGKPLPTQPETNSKEPALKEITPVSKEDALVTAPQPKENKKSLVKDVVVDDNNIQNQPTNDGTEDVVVLDTKREVTRFDVNSFTEEPKIKDPAIVNNTIAYTSVTSSSVNRKTDEDAQEPAVTDGDFKDKKKTPAKGFFRKVSRFIERNTGIGTVNADNELLIGAVALKLK